MSGAPTPTTSGTDRIAAAFAGSGKRAALMPYLMGGYPSLGLARDIALAYADAGADLVELGVPFSDPLADGPVIHAAGTQALADGVRVDDVLRLGEQIAERLPVVLMLYANLVHARGFDAFPQQLADHGFSGMIIPDIPLEEAPQLAAACDGAGVALVPLVAPTTPDARLSVIGSRARGFIYTVSVTGTTGERTSIDATDTIARVKAATDVPVALGFGISSPETARQAADSGADGVIVGTRLVRAAGEPDPVRAVSEVVGSLADALR